MSESSHGPTLCYNSIEKRIVLVAKKKSRRDFKIFALIILTQFMRNPFIQFFDLVYHFSRREMVVEATPSSSA